MCLGWDQHSAALSYNHLRVLELGTYLILLKQSRDFNYGSFNKDSIDIIEIVVRICILLFEDIVNVVVCQFFDFLLRKLMSFFSVKSEHLLKSWIILTVRLNKCEFLLLFFFDRFLNLTLRRSFIRIKILFF